MILKKVRKLIATVLTVALISNGLTSVAGAVTQNYNGGRNNNIPFTVGEDDPKNNLWKISNEIDTTSNEMISVIVEFVSEPLAGSKESYSFRGESKVDRDHRLFEQYLSKLPTTYSEEEATITYAYKEVFNGVALTINSNQVEGLLNSGVVKRIHNDSEVKVEPIEENETISLGDVETFMMDSLPALGIDELHNEGINGTGIKVGVLDTGIDYNHPDLTNAYKGFRAEDGDSKNQDINEVIGWDFIDNDADPMEATYEDWLNSGRPEYIGPSTYYTSHGTHVSGTIAGTASNEENEYAVLGVAPNVELYGYRVLGEYGSGSTAGIIAAIEKALLDGMDVINLSLGTAGDNGPYDPQVTAVNNASLAGIVTVIANGNAGPNVFTVGSPATAQLPIAVGASNVEQTINGYGLNINGLEISSLLLGKSYSQNVEELLNKELEIVHCGLGDVSDYEGKDLTGKIALVDRGIITFVEKAKNAYNAGAQAVILANNDDSNEIPFLGEIDGSNLLVISKADGDKLKEVLDSKLTIEAAESVVVDGDKVTGFSSVGPVKQSYEIRPDIVAPGSQVFSTVPEYFNNGGENPGDYTNSYARMSGTSMAAPHVAGIAALILQQNPDYTPEDVKLAMMNTSEHIYDVDGSNYSVHQAGAGRVNAYEAVHEDITFSATYDVLAGPEQAPLENTTGMISFGKVVNDEINKISKKVSVTVENNSAEAKSYNINVEYSNSGIARDAVSNGVVLNTPGTVTVVAGAKESFEVELVAPASIAEYGIYEGYIHFVDSNDINSTYQMPFSISILKSGFAYLGYPEIYDGFGEGITSITSSDIFMRHPATYYGFGDISFLVEVNEALKSVSAYVVDPETNERIGFAGKEDTSWLPAGNKVVLENFVPHGRVKKLVDGKVSHEEYPLGNGAYLLEVVGEEYNGNTFSEYLPMAIINDISKDTVSYNMDLGVVEATEDLYTNEVWYDGNEHEALWIKANVNNEILDTLKNEYGMDYIKQNHLNTVFAFGGGRDGYLNQIGNMVRGDNEILIAGIERSDLTDGLYRVELDYTNAGRIMRKPEVVTFVTPGKAYIELDTETDRLSRGDKLDTTLTISNGNGVTKGEFTFKKYGDIIYDNITIEATNELKELCADNITAEIELNLVEEEWESYEEIRVTFEVGSDDPAFKGIVGDMELFDISFEVSGFKGIGEDLRQDRSFIYDSFEGVTGEFFDATGESVDVMSEAIFNTFYIDYTDRTLIYGQTMSPLGGMSEVNVYAVDPDGNRYEPTYVLPDQWSGRGVSFTFNDLPVIDGDYKVISAMPGCFDSIMNVPGSKINENNERVGNSFGIVSVSMAVSFISYAGDVNGDGAIDIVDAYHIAQDYVEGTEHTFGPMSYSEENVVTDLSQDGEVNYYDMYLLLSNYLMQDLSRSDSKIPEEYLDGRDIIDILESCGYYDEVPELDIKLNVDSQNSLVGDAVILAVTNPPDSDGVPFEYEFAVREKNDKDWTPIGERSDLSTITWNSTEAGQYEFRARVYFDDIEYVWQDNTTHIVNWAETESVTISGDLVEAGVVNMNTGDETEVTATINPWNAMPQDLSWSSSDDSVVSVENGKLTALKEGTATVTVKTADKMFSTSIEVNVKDIAVEGIELNKNTLDLKINELDELTVTFKPENATNKNVTWSVEDSSVATVENGKVVAKSSGTTTVTATSEDGGFTASCKVKVSEEVIVKPEANKLVLDKNKATLKVGDKLTLNVSVNPDGADMPEVEWVSSDEKVATVKDGVVTAVGDGKATITVRSKDGKLKDTCKITVNKKDSSNNGNGNNNNGNGNLPNTGAVVGSAAVAAIGALVIGAGITVLGKKKREDEE